MQPGVTLWIWSVSEEESAEDGQFGEDGDLPTGQSCLSEIEVYTQLTNRSISWYQPCPVASPPRYTPGTDQSTASVARGGEI